MRKYCSHSAQQGYRRQMSQTSSMCEVKFAQRETHSSVPTFHTLGGHSLMTFFGIFYPLSLFCAKITGLLVRMANLPFPLTTDIIGEWSLIKCNSIWKRVQRGIGQVSIGWIFTYSFLIKGTCKMEDGKSVKHISGYVAILFL